MMNDDDNSESFMTVLRDMETLSSSSSSNKTNKRGDVRSVRLAAVTSALLEVVGDRDPHHQPSLSPAQVYASIIQALEQTLGVSLATQVALLELLQKTVPHVSTATIGATVSVSSRTLRAIVTSCHAATATTTTTPSKNNNADKEEQEDIMTRGNDELGIGVGGDGVGINATLRGVINASMQIIKKLPLNTPEKTVRSLYYGTILSLFEDARPKVRKAAHNATMELLLLNSSSKTSNGNTDSSYCHTAIRKSVQSYGKVLLERAKSQDTNSGDNVHLLHFLGFLQRSYPHVIGDDDEQIRSDVMELLMMTLQQQQQTKGDKSAPDDDFVCGMVRTDMTQHHKILLIHGLLSTCVAMLEEQQSDEHSHHHHHHLQQKQQNDFSTRVLASLLQARPMVVLVASAGSSSSCNDDDLTESIKVLYGRALILSSQHVLESEDTAVGCKLFPLAIQKVLQLCRPSLDDGGGTPEVAQMLMVELTRTFRLYLAPLVEGESWSEHIDQCLQDCLRGMEQVLHHSFRPTWSVTLQALAFLLHLMQDNRCKVPAVVESLIQLRALVEDDVTSRDAVESSIGSLIQGVGIETFWNWVSWKYPENANKNESKKKRLKSVEGVISVDRTWLLPLMKTSSMAAQSHRPKLGFFQSKILDLARQCDAFGHHHESAATFHRARVIDLWSLFPCVCRHPTDLEATFPSLSQTLVRAMGDVRYPELVNIICGGLRSLAMNVYESNNGESDLGASASDFEVSAQRDAKVLAESSTKILPALFKLVETIQGTTTKAKADDMMDVDDNTKGGGKNAQRDSQRVQSVIDAIAAFARLAPMPYLQNLFKKVMQRLLAATQSEQSETEKICALLSLSQALVVSQALDDSSISLLYRAFKPFIRTDEHEARVQKRAYKVLYEICQSHTSFVVEPRLLNELIELLLDSIMTSQVSARHMRLKCMALIVEGFEAGNSEHKAIISRIVPEVLLCLKDSNGKTREAAFQLLISMAEVEGEDKIDIFRVIMAALGAQTPHMRSAAVVAMSRLVFEYARVDEVVYELLPSLLQTVTVLFDEDSREVIKSVVGFVRVSVAAMSPEQLEPLLPQVVDGLLKYHRGKDRFRSKIKIILKKLVRMYGYDALMPLVPESDTRLLTHMRKLSERAERKKAAQRQDGEQESNDFDDLMESDEDDSDDGRTFMSGATGFTQMTGRTGKSIRSAATMKRSLADASTTMSSRTKRMDNAPRLRAEVNGEVMDMLDPRMAKSVHFARHDDDDDFSDNDSDSEGGVMEFDEMGRLVVRDEESSKGAKGSAKDEVDEYAVPSKRRRISKFEQAKASRDEQASKKGKQKVRSLGAAYKSKKAGGDVKRKGQKYEPYAFVPLDGKSYSKKNRRKTVEQMSTVVRHGGKRKR